MNPSREQLLFGLVLMKPAAERAAWLDRECMGDSALRQRLEARLAGATGNQGTASLNSDDAGARVEDGCSEVTPTLLDQTPLTEGPGTVIGRYKLLEQIGEGGFGVVYVAEQQEPVRRQVALKIIKLGWIPGRWWPGSRRSQRRPTTPYFRRFGSRHQSLDIEPSPSVRSVG